MPKPLSKPSPKPLWGFGWAGWSLLAVAITLAAMMLAGVNIRFWIMSRVHHNLGWDATVWFVVGFINSHVMFDFPFIPMAAGAPLSFDRPPEMRFSIITMCLTTIALQVHPGKTGATRMFGLIVIGLVIPSFTMNASNWLRLALSAPKPGAPFAFAFAVFLAGSAVISMLAMRWITRSARMAAVSAGFLLVGAWLSAERAVASIPLAGPYLFRVFGNETWFTLLAWAWNPMYFACLLTWAIRARPRIYASHCCATCGYDLRGSPSGVCPECGSTPVPALSTS